MAPIVQDAGLDELRRLPGHLACTVSGQCYWWWWPKRPGHPQFQQRQPRPSILRSSACRVGVPIMGNVHDHSRDHLLDRPSSTILLVAVPREQNFHQDNRREYAGVRTVWLVNVPKELDEDVDDRDTAADKLEVGETKLLQNFVKRQLKDEKKNKSSTGAASADGGRSAIEVNKKDRPTHRLKVLKFLPFGKKVDTIEWSRDELKRLIPEVSRKQEETRHDRSKPQGACFVEFESVQATYAVFQQSGMKNKMKMTPTELGTHPDNVVSLVDLGTA
jgi:hypothetical protein